MFPNGNMPQGLVVEAPCYGVLINSCGFADRRIPCQYNVYVHLHLTYLCMYLGVEFVVSGVHSWW